MSVLSFGRCQRELNSAAPQFKHNVTVDVPKARQVFMKLFFHPAHVYYVPNHLPGTVLGSGIQQGMEEQKALPS